MKLRILTLALAGLSLMETGCRSYFHAGGGQGVDAGAAIAPAPAVYSSAPPEVVPVLPPAAVPVPDKMPPR